MATRTIEVCDNCGRGSKDLRLTKATIQCGDEPNSPWDELQFPFCRKRAKSMVAKAFAPTPSGKKRLEETA